jgi:uncharacterized protein (TIGR02246 family)
MNAVFRLTATVVLMFAVVTPALADEAPSRDRDEAALRKLVAEQAEAWNRQDAAAWSGNFAPDAEFINIVGRLLSGRAEIEKRHAFIFSNIFKGSRTQVTVRKILFPAADVAVVDMDHVVTGFTGLPPGVQATEEGTLRTRMRYVLKKSSGTWWILAGQNTDVKPAPAPRPASAPTGSKE